MLHYELFENTIFYVLFCYATVSKIKVSKCQQGTVSFTDNIN